MKSIRLLTLATALCIPIAGWAQTARLVAFGNAMIPDAATTTKLLHNASQIDQHWDIEFDANNDLAYIRYPMPPDRTTDYFSMELSLETDDTNATHRMCFTICAIAVPDEWGMSNGGFGFTPHPSLCNGSVFNLQIPFTDPGGAFEKTSIAQSTSKGTLVCMPNGAACNPATTSNATISVQLKYNSTIPGCAALATHARLKRADFLYNIP